MNFADNNILLILISLVFIYAVLSILVSILTEWLNYYFKERGIFLKDSIYKLLKDPINKDYGYLFYNHVTIAGLKSAPDKLPQYVSSRMFAEVLIDIIAQQAVHNRKIQVSTSNEGAKKYKLERTEIPESVIERFQVGINEMNTSQFTDLMQSFLDKSENNYDKLKAHIEQWFNDYMDRVSGWYKTKQRKKFLAVGFLVAISLNVDSLHLLKVLSLDDNLKNRLVESAEHTVDNLEKDSTMRSNISFLIKSTYVAKSNEGAGNSQPDSNTIARIHHIVKQLDSNSRVKDSIARMELNQLDSAMSLVSELNIPIGWSKNAAPLSWFQCRKLRESNLEAMHPSKTPGLVSYLFTRNNDCSFGNILKYLLGIIISGVSLSFGAPFWFELLAKFVNIRRSGKIPEGDKSSKS
ncbi:hypothetical protein [Fluviicola chungangensis]|uniref:Uncharacterized protein n=1 Tax=Fluviicola chungangensis TaxID=2597671 RepID=A0A556MJ78_9FLAO|nr:hypothetical protein [Fluviicola chungangensis]TSJ39922.1 hypothetical protein FO442_16575 [Fluviicola chungangensis]